MVRTLQDTILPAQFFTGRISAPGNDTLSADDKLRILDVSLRFEWNFDSQHMDELSELLTEDVVPDHCWGFREGRKAVMDLLRSKVASTRGMRRQSTNAVLVPNPDGSVSVFAYLFSVNVANGKELPGIAGHGAGASIALHGCCNRREQRWRPLDRAWATSRGRRSAEPSSGTCTSRQRPSDGASGRRAARAV